MEEDIFRMGKEFKKLLSNPAEAFVSPEEIGERFKNVLDNLTIRRTDETDYFSHHIVELPERVRIKYLLYGPSRRDIQVTPRWVECAIGIGEALCCVRIEKAATSSVTADQSTGPSSSFGVSSLGLVRPEQGRRGSAIQPKYSIYLVSLTCLVFGCLVCFLSV